jgi:hypothetical protein
VTDRLCFNCSARRVCPRREREAVSSCPVWRQIAPESDGAEAAATSGPPEASEAPARDEGHWWTTATMDVEVEW